MNCRRNTARNQPSHSLNICKKRKICHEVRSSHSIPGQSRPGERTEKDADSHSQNLMAVKIIVNAKASRPSVCNAAETLLIHSEIAPFFLPAIEKELVEHGVSLRADARALEYLETAALAEEADWDTEYLDYILAVKVVDSLSEAIAHINRHNTKHSGTRYHGR